MTVMHQANTNLTDGTRTGHRMAAGGLTMGCLTLAIIGSLYWAGPAAAQTGASEVAASTSEVGQSAPGTARQQAWLKATVDQRVKLAEQVGDEGARSFAKAKTWNPVFDGTGRALIQGPDQVYLGSDDLVHVIEAKGGSGQLGHAYGHPQGSSEWAVKAAKKVLRHPHATEAERRGAQLILEAASKGRLQVHVVRTSHILGEPRAAVLEQTVKCSDEAASLAQSALDDIARAVAPELTMRYGRQMTSHELPRGQLGCQVGRESCTASGRCSGCCASGSRWH